MNGRNTSDVHTCVATWSISWAGTFLSEVNNKLVVKLNTGCVQIVVTTERGGLGRPSLGTDAEDLFFQEQVTLTLVLVASPPATTTLALDSLVNDPYIAGSPQSESARLEPRLHDDARVLCRCSSRLPQLQRPGPWRPHTGPVDREQTSPWRPAHCFCSSLNHHP
jgi:hypothetical protein